MTRDEALQVMKTADTWFQGLGARMIEHSAPGGYAIAVPASESESDLWYLLEEYDMNHLEQLEAIAHSPFVARLSLRSA